MGSVALFVPHVGCPQQCSFCDQRAITGGAQPPTPWQVWQAAQAAASHLGQQVKDTEIAFFGAALRPSPGADARVAGPAKEAVERFGFRGLRCSTRPDAIDGEVLSLLKAYHMVAVELGAQSMDGEVLRRNRRGHSPEDTVRAAGLIRAAGLELGLQMMTGLYGSTPEKDVETARALIALQPATARVYPTVVLEGTHLAALYRQGHYHPQTLEEAVALCARLLPLFEEAGVRVIRVGLHAQEDVERRRVAGPYHPAFRELVESRLFLARLLPELEKQPPGAYAVRVCPRQLSVATGQKRCNVEALARRGYAVRFVPDASLAPGRFGVGPQETRNEKGKQAQ
ncbi:MAG: elongator complex protein 3 [Acutalibacter sp.]